jgi:hypothetical protein
MCHCEGWMLFPARSNLLSAGGLLRRAKNALLAMTFPFLENAIGGRGQWTTDDGQWSGFLVHGRSPFFLVASAGGEEFSPQSTLRSTKGKAESVDNGTWAAAPDTCHWNTWHCTTRHALSLISGSRGGRQRNLSTN